MPKERKLIAGTILGIIVWSWLVPSTCHGYVFPKLQIQSSSKRVLDEQLSSPCFSLKCLFSTKKLQDDAEENQDYYDGEYQLESNDSDKAKFNPFSRRFTKSEENVSSGGSKRVRPNFEAVFQGMPGLSDILSGGKKETPAKIPINKNDQPIPPSANNIQDQLSTSDLEEIEYNFQKFKNEMRETLQKMRRKDPNSIPENAEFILDQVVEEQRAYDIQEKVELRARQAFDAYYEKQMSKTNLNTPIKQYQQENIQMDSDPVVQEIAEEINQQQEAKRQIEEQLQDFQTYERTLREKFKSQAKKTTSLTKDTASTASSQDDFDQVQLDIIRDLLIKRQEAALEKGMVQDEDLFTTNNLEDGIEELSNVMEEKQRLGKDILGGSKWSLKDWQMYRSIVSKLVDKKKRQQSSDTDDYLNPIQEDDIMDLDELLDEEEDEMDDEESLVVDNKVISKKLESWREYQLKEENMRKQMGLSMNVRGPFPWSEKLYKGETIESEKDSSTARKKSFSRDEIEEASLALDQTAIKVMTDLMMKTQDKERREKLRLEIEELKTELNQRLQSRSDLYNDFDDDNVDTDDDISISEPMQISDIIGNTKGSNTLNKGGVRAERPYLDTLSLPIQESPSSPPPSSSKATYAKDFSKDKEDDEEIIPTLGTLKEQKFRSLVARSGVKNVQEQEELRQKWEDFQIAEQKMRDQLGLSGNNVSSINLQGQLKYNVSDVLLKGGDVNADAILSTIGKRPSRKNKDSAVTGPVRSDLKEEGDVISSAQPSSDLDGTYQTSDTDNQRPSPIKGKIKTSTKSSSISSDQMPAWLKREIEEKRGEEFKPTEKETSGERLGILFDDIYDDEDYEKRERQAAEFERKYSKASKEVSISDLFGRDYFGSDDVGDYYDGRSSSDSFSSFESRKATLMQYRVLSIEDLNSLMEFKSSAIETGVSPYLAKVKRPFSSFGAIFKLEGSLLDIAGLHFDPWKKTAEEHGLKVPNYDDVKFASVHSPEYSIQRVFYWTNDIIFVRSLARSFRRNFSEFFEAWIKSLDTKSIDKGSKPNGQVAVLGSLKSATVPSDNAQSSESDRPSRSISLSEIDILNVQVNAWSRVSDKYGFKSPSTENVQFTSGFTPEEAVKGVFMWTRDSSAVSDISTHFRAVLKEETDKLLKKKNIQLLAISQDSDTSKPKRLEDLYDGNSKDSDKTSYFSQNANSETQKTAKPANTITEDDVMELHLKAWTYAAQQHGYRIPSLEEVQIAKFSGPEKAVQLIFQWSSSPSIVVEVVATFRVILKNLSLDLAAKINTEPSSRREGSSMSSDKPEPYIIKNGIVDFLSALEKVNTPCAVISHLESSQLDLLLQISGLDRFFKEDQRVSEKEGYETEEQKFLGAALRMERRPDLCAVFTSTPQSCVAAHDVQMKSVALVGPYPRYDLTTSDSTLINLDSMNTMNLRALFSDAKTSEPMEQLQVEGPQVKKKPLIKTRFWQEGDR